MPSKSLKLALVKVAERGFLHPLDTEPAGMIDVTLDRIPRHQLPASSTRSGGIGDAPASVRALPAPGVAEGFGLASPTTIGANRETGRLDASGGAFCYDPWVLYGEGVLDDPNTIVLGKLGQGKSALVKTLL